MAHKKQLTTHRNYKDTVFRMLFSDRKNLLSLYNAVSGAHYEDPECWKSSPWKMLFTWE